MDHRETNEAVFALGARLEVALKASLCRECLWLGLGFGCLWVGCLGVQDKGTFLRRSQVPVLFGFARIREGMGGT